MKHVLLMILLLLSVLVACDPDGKKDCVWVLEPEPSLMEKVDTGYIPVCARNRKTMKQDCRLQAKLAYAKSTAGKTFRYDDLVVESLGIPRTIKSVKFCDE